jgi:Lar family restriction alleviation protein
MANDEKVKAEEAALLPCPMCGTNDLKLTQFGIYSNHVYCKNCGLITKAHINKAVAISVWNTRPLADTAAYERGKADASNKITSYGKEWLNKLNQIGAIPVGERTKEQEVEYIIAQAKAHAAMEIQELILGGEGK